MPTDRQLREVFHFCFLERLLKVSEPSSFVLKGGVNLRFFFHSPRYSEDMDLDVFGGSVSTLRKNGYKILNDPAFRRLLQTQGIQDLAINDPSKAKQTETTQRFRLRLLKSSGEMLPTKVEFSRRRTGKKGVVLDFVSPEIARQYQRLAFRFQHYSGQEAVLQKILALAKRSEVQARDVFDLHLLMASGHAKDLQPRACFDGPTLASARTHVESLQYEDYKGHVIEFLEEDARPQFEARKVWDKIREKVLEVLSNEKRS